MNEGFKPINNNTGGPMHKQIASVSQLTIFGTLHSCVLIERMSRPNRVYHNFQSACGAPGF